MTASSWWDYINPFGYLGSAAGKVVAEGWTAAMLGLWNAGLWLLRWVLVGMDYFLTPDLRPDGPGAGIYPVTLWLAIILVSCLILVQLGAVAWTRNGRALARVFVGTGQFVLVWALVLGVAALIVLAVSGLTRSLMQAVLGIDMWADWEPFATFSTQDITDGTLATVLGLLGVFLWFAALGIFVIFLVRAAVLIVLVATSFICAAGLVSEIGKDWFWKSTRWFLAMAFTPVVIVLILGVGVQVATGVVSEQTPDLGSAVGTAVPAVMLICIATVAPLALFRLLAFVDPGTSNGAALRAGIAQQGGIQHLLSKATGLNQSGSSNKAASADAHGRAAGEGMAEGANQAKATAASNGGGASGGSAAAGTSAGVGVAGALSGAAAAFGLGVTAVRSIGQTGASLSSDVTNQASAGAQSYYPDFSGTAGRPGQGRTGKSGRDRVPVAEQGEHTDSEAG